MSTPIYYIQKGHLSFADKILFQDLNIFIYPGDKICLIGRNGSGKTSLLKVISGEYELNQGQIFAAPGVNIAYLKQESSANGDKSVYEFVLENISGNIEDIKYQADIILDKLQIDGNSQISELSGGMLRRVFLARSLITQPQILLLDEPTNHLDIASIQWLEGFVKSYKGAIICISHDKSFLSNVTNKIWWLDRAVMRKTDQGFKNFSEWQEEVLTIEENHLRKLGKKLNQEQLWMHQGVTARRKRNQKRVAQLSQLREQIKQKQTQFKQTQLSIHAGDISNVNKSKFIIEADNISYAYTNDSKHIIKNFSIRVIKGEKIGLIGPNGGGKTTLIKLLTKELEPDFGKIKHGKTLDITYFDQHRTALNPNDTLQETLCPGGGDMVFLPDDTSLHVAAYLKNFMFDPKQARDKVATLSGGQANRLLLAKALANPGNLLVLDEPTNDLDLDSLEILQDILIDYPGTLFLVSHDRDFLENIVTRTLIFEGNGKIVDYMGGYEDYQKDQRLKKKNVDKNTNNKASQKPESSSVIKSNDSQNLSYKYKRKLEIIPKQVADLEQKIVAAEKELGDPLLFSDNPEKFQRTSTQLKSYITERDDLELEWLEILAMQEELNR